MLVIACVLVGLIIFLGWDRLIEPFSAAWALPLAAMITLLAGLIARHIGLRWHRDNADAQAEGRPPGYRWLLSYPAFFLISALGVINVAFYYLEGPTVLKQNIDEAEQTVTALNTMAHIELRNVGHEEKVDRVNQLVAALVLEIENPTGICGVGSAARKTIADIQTFLPLFKEIRVRGTARGGKRARRFASIPDCHSQDLVALANAYRAEADSQLASDPDFARTGGPQRDHFLSTLGTDTSAASDRFKAARQALDASTPTQRNDAYATAKDALEGAADSYANDRQIFDRLAGHAHPSLPTTLDLSPAHDLGSLTTILHSLLRRFWVFTTWIYILIAIALDFAILALMKSAHAEFARRGGRAWRERDPGTRVTAERGSGPRFLWVNPD